MDTNEKQLFRTAFKKTIVKGVIVVGLTSIVGAAMVVIPFFDRTISSNGRVMSLALGAFFLAVTALLGWNTFARLPKRFARFLETLENAPSEIVSVKVTAYHSEVVGANGLGAQWTIDVALRDGKLRLMPGKQEQAEPLLAVLRTRAPHALPV